VSLISRLVSNDIAGCRGKFLHQRVGTTWFGAICGGTFGVLAIREGDGFRAAHGVGREFTESLTRFYHPVPGTTLDTVQETKRTIQIADCAAEPAYEPVRARNPAHAMVRTHLCVPMLRDSELLGAILGLSRRGATVY